MGLAALPPPPGTTSLHVFSPAHGRGRAPNLALRIPENAAGELHEGGGDDEPDWPSGGKSKECDGDGDAHYHYHHHHYNYYYPLNVGGGCLGFRAFKRLVGRL